MSNDPFKFTYDRTIYDKDNEMQVDVTVVDADLSDSIQITLISGNLRIPFFLSTVAAMELARLLVNAVEAYDRASAQPETITE